MTEKEKKEVFKYLDRKEIFEYLDSLRKSGKTNMFGAGIYVQKEYKLSKVEAHSILWEWMHKFKA
jgi:hypothetical protein